MESVATGQEAPGNVKMAPAEADRHEEDHAHGFKVSVVYNGVEKEFRVRPHDLVKQLLDQAIQAFGITGNIHLMSIYSAAGAELSDGQTVKDAGIKPHDELLLRPSAVKGG